jgi:multiple sugar transport system substrate-binding protein
MFAYGADIMDPEEGYTFSSPEVVSMAESWKDPINDGCGTLLYSYPDPMASELVFENFNRREAIMVMGSSRLMSHVHTEANSSGRADDWLMLPFPGNDGDKVVTSDVQAGVIFKTTPAEELASWLFLKYLVSPEVQAEWAEYSGDYPTNKSSLRFLREYRNDHPNWSQGLNLLKYAVPVPLDPSWNTVQLALGDAFEEILSDMTLDLNDQLDMLDMIAMELWEYSRQTE